MQVSTSVLTCIFLCPTSGTRGEARQEMPQGGGINRRQNSGQMLFSVRRSQAESPGGVTKIQATTNVLACIFLCSTSGTSGVARQEMSQSGKNHSDGNQIVKKMCSSLITAATVLSAFYSHNAFENCGYNLFLSIKVFCLRKILV